MKETRITINFTNGETVTETADMVSALVIYDNVLANAEALGVESVCIDD